ncbi:MAG TPA: DUF2314 domain-containing protein [Planctomycetota bacterium]|jgi:uncharacterized protein YegJ (DUF2314 family)
MNRLRLPIAAILLLGLTACGNAKKPATLTTEYDQKEMDAAIESAKKSFGEFKARMLQPQEGDKGFAIKVPIKDSNGTEHFWLNDINVQGEEFSGVIGNEPGIVKCVKMGESYKFKAADISDWMYMSKGVMQGNYTLHVLLKTMPAEEAKDLKRRIGW